MEEMRRSGFVDGAFQVTLPGFAPRSDGFQKARIRMGGNNLMEIRFLRINRA